MQQLCALDSFSENKKKMKRLKRLEQTFLWKWKYSKVTCIMGTPQIYLSRQPSGKKNTLTHSDVSERFLRDSGKKSFCFPFVRSSLFWSNRSSNWSGKGDSVWNSSARRLANRFWWMSKSGDFKELKFERFIAFLFAFREAKNRNHTYFRFATHWNLLLKCFHLFSINNFMLFFSFLSLSPAWIENNLKEEWTKWVHCVSTRDWNIEGAFIVQIVINLIFGWVSLSSDPKVPFC